MPGREDEMFALGALQRRIEILLTNGDGRDILIGCQSVAFRLPFIISVFVSSGRMIAVALE